MKRIPNWHAALAAEFDRAKTQSFAWGIFDCALCACNLVKAQTGVDPGAGFRGKYSSEKGAAALLTNGLGALAAEVAAQFGMPEVSTGHAGRGDLVLIANGTPQGALAVVDFTGCYAVCPGAEGMIRVRRHRWVRAWRV